MTELELITKDYHLSLEQLGNLMSEYYGRPLTGSDDDGTIIFGFEEEEHIPGAKRALECFPESGNYDWKKEDFSI